MKKRIVTFILASLMIMTVVASCKESDNNQPPLASGTVIVADDAIPETTPNISGVVTGVYAVREGVMLVVEPNDASLKAGNSDGNVYVTLTSKTILEDKNKKRFQSFDEIGLGITVSVWFKGSSTGTEPSYAVAHGIRIMNDTAGGAVCVYANGTRFLTTHLNGNVSSSDFGKMFYGSYLSANANSAFKLEFAERPQSFSFELYSGNELCFAEQGLAVDILSKTASVRLDGKTASGDYVAVIVCLFDKETERYAFTLHVE